MNDPATFSRRESLLLPLLAGVASMAAMPEAHAAPSGSKILVAYFTRTGNTRLIATEISRTLDADLFQIVPVNPYPEDYEQQVAQAERERQQGYEPPLQDAVQNLASYDTVFLGFPIWGMTAPAPIRSFLEQNDMSGKTLVTFITNGGYGLGNSRDVVARHAPGARLVEGFSKAFPPERETLRQVTEWLGAVQIAR